MELAIWGKDVENEHARYFMGEIAQGAAAYSIIPGQMYEIDGRTPGLQSLIDGGILRPLQSRPDEWDKVVRISVEDFQKTERKEPPIEKPLPLSAIAAKLEITPDEFFLVLANVSSFPRRAATRHLPLPDAGGTPREQGLWSMKAVEQWARNNRELSDVIARIVKRVR